MEYRQHRVDDERLRSVIRRNLKADLTRRRRPPGSTDRDAHAVDLLIQHWLAHPDRSTVDRSNQVASRIDSEGRPFEGEANGLGVGVGSDHEVVFHLSLVAVEDQVDPGVEAAVENPRVCGHVPSPSGRGADEVVDAGRQRVGAFDANVPAGVGELHPHGRLPLVLIPPGGLLQRKNGFRGGQEHGIAAAARQELHLGVGLASVHLETQRQLSIGLIHLLRPADPAGAVRQMLRGDDWRHRDDEQGRCRETCHGEILPGEWIRFMDARHDLERLTSPVRVHANSRTAGGSWRRRTADARCLAHYTTRARRRCVSVVEISC